MRTRGGAFLLAFGSALAQPALAQPAAPAQPPASPAAAAIAPAAAPVLVEVRDMRYTPAELRVPVGTVVRWVNNEKRTAHSVLFTGPGGFESERFFPGEHYERRFDKPGRHPYICGPHPDMQGVVDVTP